jgi:hypothetical protein
MTNVMAATPKRTSTIQSSRRMMYAVIDSSGEHGEGPLDPPHRAGD